MKVIYMDHAATTPMHPEVAAAMLEVMTGGPGNPSSMHAYGRTAKARLARARDELAGLLACKPAELVFTSGGTESDNAALLGAAHAMRKLGRTHIVTSSIEHHAVLHAVEALEREGFQVTIVPVNAEGAVLPETVQAAIQPDRTALVSVMWANNEVGTIQPVQAIGELAHGAGALFHTDAVQAFGSLPIDLHAMPIDLASFSAHKINGPQGIGALYIAAGTPYEPISHGGSQERRRRAGTENVAGAVGLAAAAAIACAQLETKSTALRELRDGLERRLIELLGADNIAVNGDPANRLPHIANISLLGTDTESMLMNLDLEGIAAASGSACTSGALERSHVLKAMGIPDERLTSAVRFSLGLGNTWEDIETAAQKIATVSKRIRK
jgi:cysteine desulfurase